MESLTLTKWIEPQVTEDFRSVQPTSVKAYNVLRKIGAKSSKGLCIVALEEKKKLTNNEIEHCTGLKINRICGAMYALRGCDKGDPMPKIVISAGKKFCKITGNEVCAWRLNPNYKNHIELIE